MAKGRSPNYPQLTLAEAIERVRKVYQAEHTHPAPKEIIANHLGYSGLNGASVVIIGALNRYGLVEAAEDGLRVSDNAVTILELPDGEPQRAIALREAALAPALFSELYHQFGQKLPSEASLRHSLIKQGFLPKAAEEVIRIYRGNLEMIGEESDEYNGVDVSGGSQQLSISIPPVPALPQRQHFARAFYGGSAPAVTYQTMPSALPTVEGNSLHFKISAASEAHIAFVGNVTQQGIRKLIALLQLSMDTFPNETQVRPNLSSAADAELLDPSHNDSE